jgi:hypothetical protein
MPTAFDRCWQVDAMAVFHVIASTDGTIHPSRERELAQYVLNAAEAIVIRANRLDQGEGRAVDARAPFRTGFHAIEEPGRNDVIVRRVTRLELG